MNRFSILTVANFTFRQEIKRNAPIKAFFLLMLISVFGFVFNFTVSTAPNSVFSFDKIYIKNTSDADTSALSDYFESKPNVLFANFSKEEGIEKAKLSPDVAFVYIYSKGSDYYSNIYTSNPSLKSAEELKVHLEKAIISAYCSGNEAYKEAKEDLLKPKTINVLPVEQFNSVKKAMPQNKFLFFNIIGILFIALVSFSGVKVQNTISEEKYSKLSETLFISVSPTSLILGKISGIFATILFNIFALISGGFISSAIASLITTGNISKDVFNSLAGSFPLSRIAIAGIVVSFILVYLLFSLFICMFKENYSASEEAKPADLYATIFASLCYGLSLFSFNYGGNVLTKICLYTPFVSLFYTPSMYALKKADTASLLISLALNFIVVLILGTCSVKKYKNCLFKTRRKNNGGKNNDF